MGISQLCSLYNLYSSGRTVPRFLVLAMFITASLVGCEQLPFQQTESESTLTADEADQLYRQGSNYNNGIGVEQDYATALSFYRQAAKAGSVPAMYMVGMSYSIGRGTSVDVAEARRWLLKAAEAGHAAAQYKIGTMYLDGTAVTQDAAWGVRWLGMAAYQQHERAQFSLGVCWSKGIGVPVDKMRGLSWVVRAQQQGHALAKDLSPVLAQSLTKAQVQQAKQMASARLPEVQGLENPPTTIFVQQRLSEKGYQPGRVDGVFGERTRSAMQSFQRADRLSETERVDSATLDALRDLQFWETWLN